MGIDGFIGLVVDVGGAAIHRVFIAIGFQRREQPAAEQRHSIQQRVGEPRLMGIAPAPLADITAVVRDELLYRAAK